MKFISFQSICKNYIALFSSEYKKKKYKGQYYTAHTYGTMGSNKPLLYIRYYIYIIVVILKIMRITL